MNYLVCFISSLIIFGCSKTPNDAPIYEEDPTTVTFVVDMSNQVQLGNFNSDNQDIYLAGSFDAWAGMGLEAAEDYRYTITLTALQADDEIQFKFRMDDNNWEAPNPDVSDCIDDGYGSYNRIYTVQQGENILEYWFSDDGE